MIPRLQIAFITGRSQHGRWLLSPQQSHFLHQLAGARYPSLALNFPWLPTAQRHYRRPGLLRASLSNACEYLGSRRAGFSARYRPQAEALLNGADHTLLLSGSCGLELFNNLQLSPAFLRRVSLLAYGPVARQRPDCHSLFIQGREDWISRLWFPEIDVITACGHMNYLSSAEVLCYGRDFLREVEARIDG